MSGAGPTSTSLQRVLEPASHRVVGVEREYRLLDQGIRRHAAAVWPALAHLGAHLDPGDPHARRCPWGGVLTLDGGDLELVSPPVPRRPGLTGALHDNLATGLGAVRAALSTGPRPEAAGWLTGFSTHISVEVPEDRVVAVAREVVRCFAPALMLAIDRADSPGLMIRPRAGRVEVCGEFLAGPQLRTAVALTVAVVALAEANRSRLARRAPTLRPRTEPTVERFGWYLSSTAYGPDLYSEGRAAVVRPTGPLRSSRTAGDVLGAVWTRARPLTEGVFDLDELAAVDRLVDGHDPLPLERPCDDDDAVRTPVGEVSFAPRRIGHLDVMVEAATWHRATLRVDGDGQTRWLQLSGRVLTDLLRWLDTTPCAAAELSRVCDLDHPREATMAGPAIRVRMGRSGDVRTVHAL